MGLWVRAAMVAWILVSGSAQAQTPPCDQACLQARLSTGGHVIVPPGTVTLTPKTLTAGRIAGLRITKPHTHLDCQPGATLVMDTQAPAPGPPRGIVWIDPVDDVRVTGCTLDGKKTTPSTFEDWHGVVIERSTHVVLDHVTIQHLHGDGVFSHLGPKNVTMRNLVLRRIVGQGISGTGWDGLLIDNVDLVESLHTWGSAEGMILRGRNIEVRGGHIRDFGPISAVQIEDCLIEDMYVEMPTRSALSGGIGCGGKDQYCHGLRVRNVTVDGSKVTSGSAFPIRIGGAASDVEIEGVTVIRPPIPRGNGIDVVYDGAPKRGIHIRGGTIKGAVNIGTDRLVRASVAVIGPAEQFENITVTDVTNESPTACISVVGKRGVRVVGNHCMDGGITVVGGEGTVVSGNAIHDLLSRAEPGESGDVSLTVLAATRCDVSHNYVTTGAKSGGVLLRNTTDCLVTGNRVAVLAPRGHFTESGADRNRYLDNLILGTGLRFGPLGAGSRVRELP